MAFVLPLISDLTEAQYRLLVLLQSVTVAQAQSSIPPLLDEDVAEGAAAAAATLETAGKGIIYQHQAVSVPAQRLASEYGRVIGEIATSAGSQQARLERDAAAALRRLEQGARTAAKTLAGDEPPVYLKLLGRMLQPAPPGQTKEDAPASSSGLIVTP